MHVEHRAEDARFVIRLPEGDAVLRYADPAPDLRDIRSTFVPPAARGRGIGGALVRAALEHARAEGRRVIATCWYVDSWVARHPEYGDLLVR